MEKLLIQYSFKEYLLSSYYVPHMTLLYLRLMGRDNFQ